jgi:hypothetical protein
MHRENVMNAAGAVRRRDGERGVALLIALLSLMVLTLLGLTLAATTSTELQIASNYRWSQQALYNAEAGVEIGKSMLARVPTDWASILPPARGRWKWNDTSTWPGTTQPASPSMQAGVRNWENSQCDQHGAGQGYGVVLGGPSMPAGLQTGVQYATDVYGQNLNGAFTLWVRRGVNLMADGSGDFQDDVSNSALILTSEGIAPYVNGNAAGNAAVRVFEVALVREDQGMKFCENYHGQNGGGISGDNFGNCANLGATGSNPMSELDTGCRGDSSSVTAGFGSGAAGGLGATTNR